MTSSGKSVNCYRIVHRDSWLHLFENFEGHIQVLKDVIPTREMILERSCGVVLVTCSAVRVVWFGKIISIQETELSSHFRLHSIISNN